MTTRNRSFIELYNQMVAMGEYYASGRPVHVAPDIIIDDVLSKLPIGGSDVVLDVGCGTGVITSLLSKHCRTVYALDAGQRVIDAARAGAKARQIQNVNYCVGSAVSLPFAEGSFDKVLMYTVIHYLDDDSQVTQCVAELVRVCKRGGRILIAEVPDQQARDEFDRRAKTLEEQRILNQFVANRGEYDRLFSTHVDATPVTTNLVLDCSKILAEGIRLGCQGGSVCLQDIRQPFSLTRRDVLLLR